MILTCEFVENELFFIHNSRRFECRKKDYRLAADAYRHAHGGESISPKKHGSILFRLGVVSKYKYVHGKTVDFYVFDKDLYFEAKTHFKYTVRELRSKKSCRQNREQNAEQYLKKKLEDTDFRALLEVYKRQMPINAAYFTLFLDFVDKIPRQKSYADVCDKVLEFQKKFKIEQRQKKLKFFFSSEYFRAEMMKKVVKNG